MNEEELCERICQLEKELKEEKEKINLLKETVCESLNKLAIYDNTEAIKIQTEFNKKIEELK